MNSAISYEDHHERIWIDNFAPFIFGQVTKLPTVPMMSKANAKKVEAVRHQVGKFNFAYSIIDTSEIDEANVDAITEYCNGSLLGQFKEGLEYVAFLTPKNRIAARALNEALRRFRSKPSPGFMKHLNVHFTIPRTFGRAE